MSGKIRENVEAKMMASTHAPVARVGSYDLGYAAEIASMSGSGSEITCHLPLKFCLGVRASLSARRKRKRRKGCSMRRAGKMRAIEVHMSITSVLM